MFLRFNSQKFFAEGDRPGAPVDLDATPPVGDTYDLLDTSEDEVIPLEEVKPAKTKESGVSEEDEEPVEEEDELKELEEELEGPDEEKLELVTPVRRKEILSKYPKLFKDFPYLEKAYYRDQQFTEIYPSIDDAKEASQKAEGYDAYAGQLLDGNVEAILKLVKNENTESFNRIADNYMTALWNTDQSAYYHVLSNVNKQLIASMVTEGKKTGNDALIQSAAILNQYIFGTSDWSPPARLSKETNDPRAEELRQREYQINKTQFESARGDLQTRLTNSLKATIEQNIDKSESMTPYVKKAACQDAMGSLERLIAADKGFQKLKDKLWIRAAEEGFSRTAMDRIKSAFATKAKTLLPTVIKKARNEALRGLGKRVREDTEDVNDGTTRPDTRKTTSSPRVSGNTYKEKAQKIPRNMSTLDYFNQD